MAIYLEDIALKKKLADLYDTKEASKISELVFEYITKMTKVEFAMGRYRAMTEPEATQLTAITEKLLQSCPLQYVVNEAWFGGLKFFVDNNVLIPRPETEELVDWITKDKTAVVDAAASFKILDIGTGSGCIPVLLKKKLFRAKITGVDVSEKALSVAKGNATNYRAVIDFKKVDILNEKTWESLDTYDVIVSNPPYVMAKEKATMGKNVTEYEPELALFVPDNDPMLFYKKIAAFGLTHLAADGHIYVEINEALGKETGDVFKNAGYRIEIKKDMQDKERMIKAKKM